MKGEARVCISLFTDHVSTDKTPCFGLWMGKWSPIFQNAANQANHVARVSNRNQREGTRSELDRA